MTSRQASFTSLAGQAMLSTTRLFCNKSGSTSSGTSFYYQHKVGDANYLFLVTNKHVVRGAVSGSFRALRKKPDGTPDLGNSVDVAIPDMTEDWHGHPDDTVDIAVRSIAQLVTQSQASKEPLHMVFLDTNIVPSDEVLSGLSPVEQIMMFGYPNGLADEVNNLPIVRSGITASHPAVDFGGEPKFLIDASVFPGSSGSPVFIINQGSYATSGGITVGTRVLFLGVLASGHYREESGRITKAPAPVAEGEIPVIDQMIDIGVVYRSSLIAETISAVIAGTAPLVNQK